MTPNVEGNPDAGTRSAEGTCKRSLQAVRLTGGLGTLEDIPFST